jgi:hypothetical protein
LDRDHNNITNSVLEGMSVSEKPWYRIPCRNALHILDGDEANETATGTHICDNLMGRGNMSSLASHVRRKGYGPLMENQQCYSQDRDNEFQDDAISKELSHLQILADNKACSIGALLP